MTRSSLLLGEDRKVILRTANLAYMTTCTWQRTSLQRHCSHKPTDMPHCYLGHFKATGNKITQRSNPVMLEVEQEALSTEDCLGLAQGRNREAPLPGQSDPELPVPEPASRAMPLVPPLPPHLRRTRTAPPVPLYRPESFTQGKPRGHWTKLAKVRNVTPPTCQRGKAGRGTSTALQGHSSPGMRRQTCSRESRNGACAEGQGPPYCTAGVRQGVP